MRPSERGLASTRKVFPIVVEIDEIVILIALRGLVTNIMLLLLLLFLFFYSLCLTL